MLKTFKTDHLVRDAAGKPLGRVVLAGDYTEGADIAVALMDIPRVKVEHAMGQTYYIDGHAYRLPKDLPKIRFTPQDSRLTINNFFLMLEVQNVGEY